MALACSLTLPRAVDCSGRHVRHRQIDLKRSRGRDRTPGAGCGVGQSSVVQLGSTEKQAGGAQLAPSVCEAGSLRIVEGNRIARELKERLVRAFVGWGP
jgi:hypothetical protein